MPTVVSVDELKEHCLITHAAQDDSLGIVIAGIEKWVAEMCSVDWEEAERVVYASGGVRNLVVPVYPIASIDEIIDTMVGDEETLFVLQENKRILLTDSVGNLLQQRWPQGYNRWKITYQGGFDGAANVPASLKLVILELCTRAVKNRAGVRSSGVAGFNTSWADLMDTDLWNRLSAEKRGPLVT